MIMSIFSRCFCKPKVKVEPEVEMTPVQEPVPEVFQLMGLPEEVISNVFEMLSPFEL